MWYTSNLGMKRADSAITAFTKEQPSFAMRGSCGRCIDDAGCWVGIYCSRRGSVGRGQMQTLYIHVGLHKTGTTVIQKFLHDNAHMLAKHGVCFPATGRLANSNCNYGHHDLAWSLKKDTATHVWYGLWKEIKDCPSAIVSSEEFEFVKNSDCFSVITNLFHNWKIVPICYLRRQDELLQSEYNQYIKDGSGTLDIQSFSKRIESRLDYRNFINVMVSNFGKGSLILRIYDKRHLKEDIFSDFLDALGISEHGSFRRPIGTINPGLSGRGLKVMRYINQRFTENPQALERMRRLVVDRYKTNAFTKHSLLTESECQSLMARYDECNRFIAETYLHRPGEALFQETSA